MHTHTPSSKMQGRGGGGSKIPEKKHFGEGQKNLILEGGEAIFPEEGQIFAKDKQK